MYGRSALVIPYGWQECAELVGWTERQVRVDKRDHIATRQSDIPRRLGLTGDAFVDLVCPLLQHFGAAVGTPPEIARLYGPLSWLSMACQSS